MEIDEYCHTHTDTGRKYIGISKRGWLRRWEDHVRSAKRNQHGWSHFLNAIRKYGPEAFTHEVLEVCETLDQANAAEVKWIEHHKTRESEFGFNISKGGQYCYPWDRPDYRAKQIAYKTGQVFTPERLLHMSESHKGKVATEDSKTKVSISLKASWTDPEVRNTRGTASMHSGVSFKADPKGKRLLNWVARSNGTYVGRYADEAKAVEALAYFESTGQRYSGRALISRDPQTASVMREARVAAGLSLRELGERLNLTLSTVHAHETAKCGSDMTYFVKALSAIWNQDFIE